MRSHLLNSIFLFIVLVFCVRSDAQTTISRFTPDTIKFLSEITLFMEEVRKKETKEFMEEFVPIWNGGVLSDQQRKGIYSTCNFMLDKKLPAFPDFKTYLFSVMSFIKSGQSEESFDAWQINLEKMVNSKNKKKLIDYLNFCAVLFSENAIYKSGTTTWKTDNTAYQFEFSDIPFMVFPSLNLTCYAKDDSATIYNTSGIFYPTLDKWEGSNGLVTWEHAGFPKNQVYAEIGKYEIDVRSSSYEADSVVFYNTIYFKNPLLGRLSERVLANVTEERATYPRFESYDKRLRINNIFQNINYDGGFAQHGNKFIGKGSEEEDALLEFMRNDTLFLLAAAKSFGIRTDKITSTGSKVTLYIQEDSIVHPGLKLNFISKDRSLSLVRLDEGVSKSPYFNSFHKLDMYFEELRWKIDEPFMEFGPLMGATDKTALFESNDFYKEFRFDRLQGIDRVHPLTAIKQCSRKYGDSDELTLDQLSGCMHIAPSQVKLLLIKLSIEGYVSFDNDDEILTIKERLNHYLLSKSKRADYDVIQFNSKVEGQKNAKLNLMNNDLKIDGVTMIFLSDSHNVYIYPKDDQITVKKNRDFEFSGIVNAGKFEYFGQNYQFSYDNFKIDMPTVDSLRIYVNTEQLDEYGKPKESMVKSVIEYMKGELLIDNPGNKSGNKRLPRYPVFNSLKDSYVYYQRKNIQSGVYKRDSFYFHLEPFTFDSIDNFSNQSLKFNGSFSSAGIFPQFEETLSLQRDLSLGFERPTPPDGYKVYGEKGIFNNTIKLSNQGLRGDGTLEYLTSISESDDFIFFPDSMNAIAQKFSLEAVPSGTEFPPAFGENVYLHWEPYKDFMTVTHKDKPIAMYDGSKFTGTLTLKPEGLTGNGTIKFKGAELSADLMKYKFSEFDSDTAEFRLLNKGEGTASDILSFATNNVKAHVDFKERKADFTSNGGGSFVEFPQNQYIAFMDKFSWYMDNDDIELSATTKVKEEFQDVQLEGSKFISVHKDQDSLTFYSPAAKYDVKKHIITAKRVKYIPIADAFIYPDSGLVVIEKKAVMRTLENSRIIANGVTKYHTIYNASTNIFSRKNYSSSGDYDYKDENSRIQVVHFTTITVDSTAQTYASGTIDESQGFSLSPSYEYKGKVGLVASEKLLEFSGTSRILHDCEMLPRSWFSFTGNIDPNDVYIPIDTVLKDAVNDNLAASIMIKSDSVSMYSTFLSRIKNYSDQAILPVYGFLHYDKSSGIYKISNLAKLEEQALPGNFSSLNISDCSIYNEGAINFGVNLGQVKVNTVGNASHFLAQDSVVMDVMIKLDFFFVDDALESMAKDFEDNKSLEGVNNARPVYEKGLQELLGKEEADKLISQVNLYGSFKKLPDELVSSIFLSDIKMRWNKKSKSYQSVGKIGISNILKRQVNKYVDGYVEIIKKRSGDILHLYFQTDDRNWYYFTYQRNVMSAIAANSGFNAVIKAVKSDKRKLKTEKGQAPYSFLLSADSRKNSFVRGMKKQEEEELLLQQQKLEQETQQEENEELEEIKDEIKDE